MSHLLRFAGDMTHLAGVLLMLYKVAVLHDADGVSRCTQELYLLVFSTRYVDLLFTFISLYNTTMKVFFILSALAIALFIRLHPQTEQTYREDLDTSRFHLVASPPCLVLALVCWSCFKPWSFNLLEVPWEFSIFLEAVAMVPQFVLMARVGDVDYLTNCYVLLMGSYRIFYIFNWIHRFVFDYHDDWISWFGGAVQTGLFLSFCIYYYGCRLSVAHSNVDEGGTYFNLEEGCKETNKGERGVEIPEAT